MGIGSTPPQRASGLGDRLSRLYDGEVSDAGDRQPAVSRLVVALICAPVLVFAVLMGYVADRVNVLLLAAYLAGLTVYVVGFVLIRRRRWISREQDRVVWGKPKYDPSARRTTTPF